MTSQALEQHQEDFSVNQASALLGVSNVTIYNLLKRGKLAGYKVGRSRRITHESISRLRAGDV